MDPAPNHPATIRYRVLGPLEVIGTAGERLELTGHKLRSLLCALLVSPGHTVSLDRIISFLWGDEPPAAATATLQAYVSQLRKLLEPDRGPRRPPTSLVTRPPGYALVVEPGSLDADELVDLISRGEQSMAAALWNEAEKLFGAALRLRRGTPFADVADEPFAIGAVARFEQLFLVASERRADAMLALGRVGAAAADLEQLVSEHPLRERFWAQLVEALYRGGRQADALRAFQSCRARLVDELGVEPGPELQRLERVILAQETVPSWASASTPATPTANHLAPTAEQTDPAGMGTDDATPSASEEATDEAMSTAAVIGRTDELLTVEQMLLAAARGMGSIVSIEGEAGIGKSRLADAIGKAANAAGFATAWTSCVDELGTPTLWPWEQAIALLGRAVPVPPPSLLGEPDPDAVRFRRVLGVLDTVIAASHERPVLLVIDDMQWADAASLQAVRVLANRLHGARLMVVATVRRPDLHANPVVDDLLADLSRQRNARRFRLGGLGATDVGALMGELSGGQVHSLLVEAVADRTSGNPFFVSEMVRLLASERALEAAPTDAILRTVPDTVREVVERRLSRLPPATGSMLRLAALIGPVVGLDILEQATGRSAEDVITSLEAAVMTGMLVEIDDGIGWRFTHALVQDAVRAGLSRAQRARLHGTIADAIEVVHAGDLRSHLNELARHSVEAAPLGGVERALRWSKEAAIDARRDGRYDRASRLWRDALRVLDESKGSATDRFDLLLDLATDLRPAGEIFQFGRTIRTAMELATELRDQHRMALAGAELGWVNLWNTRPYGMIDDEACREIERLATIETDPALAARLFGAVAVELYYGERRTHGEHLAERAVAIARDVGDPVLLGRTLNNYVLAAWVPSRDEQRLAACSESLALAGRGLPAQTEVVARLHRASLLLRRGDIALVEADLAHCRALALEVAVPEITAQLLYAECGLGLLRGQWDHAERLAEQAFEMHSRTKVWGGDWCHTLQLVCIRGAQGRVGEIAEQAVRLAENPSMLPVRSTAVMAVAQAGDLDEARALAARWDWRSEPIDWSWDHRIADWAEAAAMIGSPDAGALYEQLLPLAGELRVSGTAVVCRGSMHAVLARLAATNGQIDAARRHRDAAAVANRSVDGSWWADRIETDLAEI